MIRLFRRDCMELMRETPDKYYDLAVVDPMYDLPDNYLCPGTKVSTTGVKRKHCNQAKKLAMQETVELDYYKELCRVSKNQIIWGINNFSFANQVKGRIFWDKKNDSSSFSDGELASCSMIKGIRIFRYL